MDLINRFINNEELPMLQINSINDKDIMDITKNYAMHKCVEIGLDLLQYLELFREITTLVIKGGMMSEEGLKCLYRQKSLETLVLDYEETESNEEAIDLFNFPKLNYVLSRSNLNICNYENRVSSEVSIVILNYYHNGKRIKGTYPDNYNLFQEKKFMFLSAEAKSPASISLIKILVNVEKVFQQKYKNVKFSDELEQISIIPICISNDMINQGFGKERRYVSLKKQIADIRIQIPYLDFIGSGEKQQAILCKQNIIEAVKYICKKDETFKTYDFLCAINFVFEKLYGI